MALHGPHLIQPKGPSKSIFQPHPATVAKAPLPAASAPGKAGKSAPSSGKPGKSA